MKLPQDFIDRTKPLLGDEWDEFVVALQKESPTSIRLNHVKSNSSILGDIVPWCADARYLESRPQFTFDPLLHAGIYYVQEASSMFVQQAVNQLINGDVRILDLCAAPGGKSTLLSGLISDNSLLVSNEIIRNRAHILAENLMKWGKSNCVVTNNRPDDFTKLKHFFDAVLVDAPCSGEGMFRKDPQAIAEWSVDNVHLCANRQKDILTSIWSCLKPEGYLFYSTCTYNREENEDIVRWLSDEFEAKVISLDVSDEWGVTKSEVSGGDTYHFYPHKTKGEGFYFAVLQKGEEPIDSRIFKPKKNKKKQTVSSEFKRYVKDEKQFTLIEEQGSIYAVPTHIELDLEILKQYLRIVSQGVCLGQVKGKDFIPHQSLALSIDINRDFFSIYEVDWITAIAYLRSEAITLDNVAKGYVLLTFRNIPLGFVKNLGTRANNLYPNEWRIRSANIPSEEIYVI